MSKNTTFDVATLIRKNILNMKPYSSARDEFKGEAEVFLDANENPFPSPWNRYPDPLQWKIKEKLGPLKGVKPQQIFLGNGSDEPIDLIIRAFCNPGADSILITEPTYGMYAVCAEVNAVNIKNVLLTRTYDVDSQSINNMLDESVKVIFLCSPNNPTGSLLNRNTVLSIVSQFQGIVVVDEAYIDFSNSESYTAELSNYPNLVVLQTFSKAWGLAGLRCGMAFASEEIIAVLNKIKYPYNINVQTQELVLDALGNVSRKDQWVSDILEQRSLLSSELAKLSLVKEVFPTDANFILVKVADAPRIYLYLMQDKIIVRDRSKVKLCEESLRITVGTSTENKRLIEALKAYQS